MLYIFTLIVVPNIKFLLQDMVRDNTIFWIKLLLATITNEKAICCRHYCNSSPENFI